ncbi:helix-turn-helix transcriptional regulator [Bifidobacterium sp. 82T10]|uniref:Helix-turn-helix transcriptional regulator n=1 Tax=Bifidobacterium miconis TaxID=2834435 RepID=A0ABS6WC71_9BIFI|nr:helix-turn-helix transcriptional regulator [Bifidobacterium miconis]MBW3091650.1 helix-turn-helix transcriptional regulator [Bifidobacterium miconis]
MSNIQSVRQLAVSLRDARVIKGITQAELADMAGISRPWINQFEQGKLKNASIDRVLTVCRILGVTIGVSYDIPEEPQVPASAPPSHAEIDQSPTDTDAHDGLEPLVDTTDTVSAKHEDQSSAFPASSLEKALSGPAIQEALTKMSQATSLADAVNISQKLQQWSGTRSLFGESYLQALKNLDATAAAGRISSSDRPQQHSPTDKEQSHHE